MLTIALREIVNKSNYEIFNTTYMVNIKKLSEKLINLSISNKMFIKIVLKPMSLGHLLTFPFNNYFKIVNTSNI